MSDFNTFFLLCNPFSGNGKPIRLVEVIKLEFKKKHVPIVTKVSDSLENFNLSDLILNFLALTLIIH